MQQIVLRIVDGWVKLKQTCRDKRVRAGIFTLSYVQAGAGAPACCHQLRNGLLPRVDVRAAAGCAVVVGWAVAPSAATLST